MFLILAKISKTTFMNTLYPLKFYPILKEKIWGGNKLEKVLNKPAQGVGKIGESWEISGIQNELSVVENGFLKGNNIQELVEVYMGDLVGDTVYHKFGIEFPLLIKFIDANEYLSIQVHPDDNMARERHNSYGKTEMWFVVDADKGAELIAGFNQQMDKTKYLKHFGSGTLRDVLNFEKVEKGDVFFMPAGRVHATGPGILFAEIQQTSDVTYRIYDWDRVGDDGKPRELHTELAVDAIDYSHQKEYKTAYNEQPNKSNPIVKSPFFTTNVIVLDTEIERDYQHLDSFVVFMCLEGACELKYNEKEPAIKIKQGDTYLVPAVLKQLFLKPLNKARLLEVYIEL
jgi:mannose-6-phosphate isomerase